MNSRTLRILVQTTTPANRDDWSVDSLSLLRQELEMLRVRDQPVIVTAKNRETRSGPDPVLAGIDRSDFDELWLFGLDLNAGLTSDECAAIDRFRRRGGGLGRAVSHSSFHLFADYNWDTRKGAPSFVTEAKGTGMASNPRAASDIRAYVANLARWLAASETMNRKAF